MIWPAEMDIDIRIACNFSFALTMEEIEILMRCARRHYDNTCKSACYVDGFLEKWKRDIGWSPMNEQWEKIDPDVKPIRATFEELDISLKILEVASHLKQHSLNASVVLHMQRSFRAALLMANKKYLEWQVTVGDT